MFHADNPFALIPFSSNDWVGSTISGFDQLLDCIESISTFGSFCAVASHAVVLEDRCNLISKADGILGRPTHRQRGQSSKNNGKAQATDRHGGL
jgi:hypothetical protein